MIRIAKLTDYGIVVLTHMARHAHRCVHSATELAESTEIPLPTVQKVLKMLARDGLVTSMRGARGGYALGCDPAEVDLIRVLEALEGPVSLTACAVPHAEGCSESGHCIVAPHWPVINRAVRDALQQVTVRDLPVGAGGMVRSRPGARVAVGEGA